MAWSISGPFFLPKLSKVLHFQREIGRGPSKLRTRCKLAMSRAAEPAINVVAYFPIYALFAWSSLRFHKRFERAEHGEILFIPVYSADHPNELRAIVTSVLR